MDKEIGPFSYIIIFDLVFSILEWNEICLGVDNNFTV